MGRFFLLLGLGLALFFVVIASFIIIGNMNVYPKVENFSYSPSINPDDFADNLDSDWYNLETGNKLIYRGRGVSHYPITTETDILTATNRTRAILGVNTTAVQWNHTTSYEGYNFVNYFWFAQDKDRESLAIRS